MYTVFLTKTKKKRINGNNENMQNVVAKMILLFFVLVCLLIIWDKMERWR